MSAGSVVGAAKQAALLALMAQAGVREEDLEEKFVRASGPGGQKVNKTSSAVWLRHLPTGANVKVQQGRSQLLNRYVARKLLCEAILAARGEEKTQRQQQAEKLRRQKRRRSRRAKARSVADKRAHGSKKASRKPPDAGD